MKKVSKLSFLALVVPLMSFTAQRQTLIRTIEKQLTENLAQKTIAQINTWYDQAHEKINAYARATKNTARAEILLDKLNKKYFNSAAIKNLLPGTINYKDIKATGRGIAPQATSARLRQINVEISAFKKKPMTSAQQLLTDANNVIDLINEFEQASGDETRAAMKRNEVVAHLRTGLPQLRALAGPPPKRPLQTPTQITVPAAVPVTPRATQPEKQPVLELTEEQKKRLQNISGNLKQLLQKQETQRKEQELLAQQVQAEVKKVEAQPTISPQQAQKSEAMVKGLVSKREALLKQQKQTLSESQRARNALEAFKKEIEQEHAEMERKIAAEAPKAEPTIDPTAARQTEEDRKRAELEELIGTPARKEMEEKLKEVAREQEAEKYRKDFGILEGVLVELAENKLLTQAQTVSSEAQPAKEVPLSFILFSQTTVPNTLKPLSNVSVGALSSVAGQEKYIKPITQHLTNIINELVKAFNSEIERLTILEKTRKQRGEHLTDRDKEKIKTLYINIKQALDALNLIAPELYTKTIAKMNNEFDRLKIRF